MPGEEFESAYKKLMLRIRILCDVPSKVLDPYRNQLYAVRFEKQSVIHRQGEEFDYALFLAEGLIRSYYLRPDGKEITYSFFTENDFVCDFESFLQSGPGKYYFESLESSLCIKIPRSSVHSMYESRMELQKLGRIIAEQSYLGVEKRLRMFMTQDLELKYRTLLAENPEFVPRVPQYYLASYLGVSAEALSRLRSKIIRSK